MKNKTKLVEILAYSPHVEYSPNEESLISHLFRNGAKASEETMELVKELGYTDFTAYEDKYYVLINAPVSQSPIVCEKTPRPSSN